MKSTTPRCSYRLAMQVGIIAMLGLSAPAPAGGQAGRLRPQPQPGESPTTHLFFDDGFTIRVAEHTGRLVISSASMIPSTEPGPPPLRQGDRLVKIGSIEPVSLTALDRFLDTLEDGDTVLVTVRRETVDVTGAYRVTTIQSLLAQGRLRMGIERPSASATPGRGGWTAAPRSPTAPPLAIAGNRVAADDTGALRVEFRSRHPASALVDLRLDDQILAVNGEPATDLPRLREAYAAVAVGDTLVLRILRDERQVDVRFAKPAGD